MLEVKSSMYEAVKLATPEDKRRFSDLEAVIERGLGTFVEVGHALLEIRDRRLYRTAGHRTFADYALKRWDLSSAHAYRQIEAAKIIDILSPIGETPLPSNEAQVRELAPLATDPDTLRSTWVALVQHGQGSRITAKAIREQVTKVNVARPASRASRSEPAHTCPNCGHTWRHA